MHIPVVRYDDGSFQVEPSAVDIKNKLQELGLLADFGIRGLSCIRRASSIGLDGARLICLCGSESRGLTLRCPLLFQLPGFDPNAISVVGKHIGKRNFPHGIRHGFGHWSIRIFENVVDIPSHGACVISSLVDADHIIEVRGFHCLMISSRVISLGGCGPVRHRRFRVPL